MIPEGRYKCRGTEAKLAFTSQGAPQVAVDIVITEEESEYCGQHRTWYGSFSDKAMDRTLQSLRFLGWQGDDLSDLAGIDQNEAYVTITHEEDQEGNIRDRAAFINNSAGLAIKTPMDDGEAKAFAERMKGHVLSFNQRTAGTPASAKPAAAANSGTGAGGRRKSPPKKNESDFKPEDGDIPF